MGNALPSQGVVMDELIKATRADQLKPIDKRILLMQELAVAGLAQVSDILDKDITVADAARLATTMLPRSGN